MSSVVIRVWHGCDVRLVVSVSPTGTASLGAVGGAGNSTRPDIEIDPWANLIVDHRADHPHPVPIREVMTQ